MLFRSSVDEYDQAKMDSMPNFLQEKIKASDEYKALMSQPKAVAPVASPLSLNDESEDDLNLPF